MRTRRTANRMMGLAVATRMLMPSGPRAPYRQGKKAEKPGAIKSAVRYAFRGNRGKRQVAQRSATFTGRGLGYVGMPAYGRPLIVLPPRYAQPGRTPARVRFGGPMQRRMQPTQRRMQPTQSTRPVQRMRISQVRTFGALERPPERPAGNQIPPEVAAELRQLSSAVKTQGTRLRYYDEMNRRWFAQEAALARAPVKKKSEPAGKRVMKALFGTLANDQNPQ